MRGQLDTDSPKAYYYLAKDGSSSITGNSYWWTMSPYWSAAASVLSLYGSGNHTGQLHGSGARITNPVVRPVVSLKSCVDYVGGDGSADNPYTVVMP